MIILTVAASISHGGCNARIEVLFLLDQMRCCFEEGGEEREWRRNRGVQGALWGYSTNIFA